MLKFENVCKDYNDKSGSKTVLKDVSFELPEKGMVFILGKSGSGKTTILNLLGSLDKVTKGSIYFEDKELSQLSNRELNSYRAHCVGFIFQEFFLFEKQTVKSNLIKMGQILHKKYTDEEISEILKEVDLEGYEEKKCNLLSSGEKQRISIARTLIKDSKIILADEPTGALDSENGQRIFNILKKISTTRLVVVVSHDLESAEKYADYTIHIKDGQVIEKTGFNEKTSENTNHRFLVEKTHGLKLMDIIKNALSNLKQTRLRTFLNLIICFIGLLLFFIANVLTTMDAPHRLVNGLYQSQIFSGRLCKKSENFHGYESFSTIEEVNAICDSNPELEFFKINRDLGGLFSQICEGVAETPQKIVNRQKLVCGEIPSDLNDFFVTKTFAEFILDHVASWQVDTDVTDIESLIGNYKIRVYKKTFFLRGIVEDSELSNNFVYFNEGFLASISDIYEKAHIEGYCTYLHFIMSGNLNADYKFFKTYHGDITHHQTKSNYVIETAISNHFYSTMASYISISNFVYGISAAQMLFVILICFSIISQSIRKNQKENGILRALGYSNFDLFKIYLMQMAIPFILLIPLVVVSGYFIIKAINSLLIEKLAVIYGMFAIGALNIVWLIFLCVGIVVISTILPMIKVFKDQPINIIKAN